MPEIEIKGPKDIEKLNGCMVHSAKIITDGPVTYLQLEVSHITMPAIVRVAIFPFASYTQRYCNITTVSGLLFHTSDVPAEEVES